MREQTSVRFKIASTTLGVSDIQTRTGLTPDETWKIGAPRGRFSNIEKANGFVLESKLTMQNSLDDHVKAMLKRLIPHAQQIGALAGEAVIEFSCIVHRKTGPAVKLERDELRWLGVMAARLEIDVFIIGETKAAPLNPETATEQEQPR